jgi:secreted trypsin-like serine protease
MGMYFEILKILYIIYFINLLLIRQIRRSNPALFTFDIGRTSRVTANPWSVNNVRVSKIVMHPSYNDAQITNDIALMKLAVKNNNNNKIHSLDLFIYIK